jgi:hypothetical protein
MESRRVNTELSRATNGNMASAWAGWEGENFINVAHIGAVDGDEAHANQHEAVYEILTEETIYNNLLYRDLSVFPSVLRFYGSLQPVDYNQFLLRGAAIFSGTAWPFAWLNPTAGHELAKPGHPIVVDSADQYGEYRIQKIHDKSMAFVVPSAANPEPLAEGTSATYAYREGDEHFAIDLSGQAVTLGDFFVSKSPICGGVVYAAVGSQYYVRLTTGNQFPPHTYQQGEPYATGVMAAWRIQPLRSVSMWRTLQVALYDLTLSYTIRNAGDIAPDDVEIEILDELDVVKAVIPPVTINGSAKFIDKPIPGGGIRRLQRMLLESKFPIYGRARIKFGLPPGSHCYLSNVNLHRGNQLEQILSGSQEKVDFVESQIDMNAEIVPRGTIVAYAGGAVCPPGYFRAEGVGELEENALGQGNKLRSRLGTEDHGIIESVDLDQRISARSGKTDPRTVLQLRYEEVKRPLTSGGVATYQQSRRLVNVVPYRMPIGEKYALQFIQMRDGYWGVFDPEPIWVTDEYDKTDIQPGCVLEVRVGQRRYFMVISQYAQGSFIDHFDEGAMHYPFGKNSESGNHGLKAPSDQRRRAVRSVYRGGTDPNTTYSAFEMYGPFNEVREEQALLEVVGDWLAILTAAKADNNAEYFVWKSGLVAHAQIHPELGDDKVYGGYGYLGEPHSHFLGESPDSTLLNNLGTGEPFYPTATPAKHRHGYLFGAATLPKVRPVLLCQKI